MFTLAKDEQVVGPTQFSQQRREFLLIAPRFVKLAHSPQVLRGESTGVRAATLNMGGKRNDGGLAPPIRSDAAANVFANAPVEVNQFGVDRVKRTLPGALYERQHLPKCRFIRRGCKTRATGASFAATSCSLNSGWTGSSGRRLLSQRFGFLLSGGLSLHGVLFTSRVMSPKSAASPAGPGRVGVAKSGLICELAVTQLRKVQTMDSATLPRRRLSLIPELTCEPITHDHTGGNGRGVQTL